MPTVLKLDFFGEAYDEEVPAFIDLGTEYFHRVSGRLYDKAALDAQVAAESYTWGTNERGVAPVGVSLLGVLAASGKAVPAVASPAGAPITATVSKVPSSTLNDTGVIQIGGGPADKAYVITLTIKDAASSGDDIQNVNVTKGMTAAQVAAALAAAESDPNATATASGVSVTVAPKTGSTIAKLSVTVS